MVHSNTAILATSRVPLLFLTAFNSSVDFDDSFPCPQYCAMQSNVSRQVAFSNLLCGRACPLNHKQNVNFTFPCCPIRSPRVHLRQIATWPNCISLPGVLKMYAQDLRCCLQIVFLESSWKCQTIWYFVVKCTRLYPWPTKLVAH